jgi:hypothetical protein
MRLFNMLPVLGATTGLLTLGLLNEVAIAELEDCPENKFEAELSIPLPDCSTNSNNK